MENATIFAVACEPEYVVVNESLFDSQVIAPHVFVV